MAKNLRDRGYSSSMDNYTGNKLKVEERNRQEKQTGPVSVQRATLPKVEAPVSTQRATTQKLKAGEVYGPVRKERLPASQFFNLPTLVQKYGNYENYLKGRAVTPSGYYHRPMVGDTINALSWRTQELEQTVNFRKRERDNALRNFGATVQRYDELTGRPSTIGYNMVDDIVLDDFDAKQQAYNETVAAYVKSKTALNKAVATAIAGEQDWKSHIGKPEDIKNNIAAKKEEIDGIQQKIDGLSKSSTVALSQNSMRGPDAKYFVQQAMNNQDEIERLYKLIESKREDLSLLEEELYWSNYYKWQDYASAPVSVMRAHSDDNYIDKVIRGEGTLEENISAIQEGNYSLANIEQMTEHEQETYKQILQKYGRDKAQEYFNELEATELNTRRRYADEADVRKIARDPLGAFSLNYLSVLLGPLKVFSYAAQAGEQLLTGNLTKDANYNYFSYMPTAIRDETAKQIERKMGDGWGKLGSLGYQTAMSMFDFLYNAAITGNFAGPTGEAAKIAENMSLGIMGTEAAADATISALDRGLDSNQAFALGTIAGIAEIFTEKVSMETLLDKLGMENGFKYLAKNFLAEGSEEVASDIINNLADLWVAKDQSEWRQTIQKYEKLGMTPQQAFTKAFVEQAEQMGISFIGGALSGGAMGGAALALNHHNFVNADYASLTSKENLQGIIDQGKMSDKSGKAYSLAVELENKLNRGETVTVKEAAEASKAALNEIQKAFKTKNVNALGERLLATENGRALLEYNATLLVNNETTKYTQELASKVLLKMVQNQEVAPEEAGRVALEAQKLLDEYYAEQRKSAKEDAKLTPRPVYENMTELEKSAARAGVSEKAAADMQRIADALGREVRFYNKESSHYERDGISYVSTENGYHDPKTGILYINARSKNPFMQVVSHELTHDLENAASYDTLRSAILAQYDNLDQRKADKIASYSRNNIELDDKGAEHELVAEYVENTLLGDEKKIRSIVRQNRTLAEWVRDQLDKLLSKFGSEEEQAAVAERKKLKEIRDIYAQVLREKAEGKLKLPGGKELAQSSLQERTIGLSGKNYGAGVLLETNELSGITDMAARNKLMGEYLRTSFGGKTFKVIAPELGGVVDIKVASPVATYRDRNNSRRNVIGHVEYFAGNHTVKQELMTQLDEALTSVEYKGMKDNEGASHGWLDDNGNNGFYRWFVIVQDQNKAVWSVQMVTSKDANGKYWLYEPGAVRLMEEGTVPVERDERGRIKTSENGALTYAPTSRPSDDTKEGAATDSVPLSEEESKSEEGEAKSFDISEETERYWLGMIDHARSQGQEVLAQGLERQLYNRKNAVDPFYSKMIREIEKFKGDRIGSSSVISYLKNHGVKEEELKWSGINTFLDGRKSVSKDELIRHLRWNLPKIDVEVLDSEGDIDYDDERDEDEWDQLDHDEETRSNAPKWGDYAIDGGENYREFLYKLRGADHTNKAMDLHWDGRAGVLAHARVQDFWAEDSGMAEAVMFVEEIQSDWHNQGHKYGYGTFVQRLEAKRDFRIFKDEFEIDTVFSLDGRDMAIKAFDTLAYSHPQALQAVNRDASHASEIQGPGAFAGMFAYAEWKYAKEFAENVLPLLDTEERDYFTMVLQQREHLEELRKRTMSADPAPYSRTYHEYVLKDLLRRAAEEGYEYLAWTPAWIQDERWNNDEYDFSERNRIEYDQDIPHFLKKYVKQWGAKLTTIELERTDGGPVYDYSPSAVEALGPRGDDTMLPPAKIPAVQITDEMRRSLITEGQPAFSKTEKKTLTLPKAESGDVGSTLRTAKGSPIERSKTYGIGKEMDNKVYVHKDYADRVVPADTLDNAKRVLAEEYPDFQYNSIQYDPKKGVVRFDEAPDFDTAPEPVVGDYVAINPDGTSRTGHSNYIWHHKWMWVDNDYTGFDVKESWEWSKKWLKAITGKTYEVNGKQYNDRGNADGNGIERWRTQLREYGLEDNALELPSVSDDDVAPVSQQFTSENTSRPQQLPALFKHPKAKFGKVNIDIGGGKTEKATAFLKDNYDAENMIFDPYNRDKETNMKVIDFLRSGKKADTATCANVLNVIKEYDARRNVILEMAKSIKQDGTAYFSCYEKRADGEGEETRDGYQNNRALETYKDEIREYFNDVERYGGIIVAKDPKPNLPKALWEYEKGHAIRYSQSEEQTKNLKLPKVEAKEKDLSGYTKKSVEKYNRAVTAAQYMIDNAKTNSERQAGEEALKAAENLLKKQPVRNDVKSVAPAKAISARNWISKQVLNTFSIPEGRRKAASELVQKYADKVLENNRLTEEDTYELFQNLLYEGVIEIFPDDYNRALRDIVTGGQIGVSESAKVEFGDDWAATRRAAFGAGLLLTNKRESQHAGTRGVDSIYRDLSEFSPGVFPESLTSEKEQLERIIAVAEQGKKKKMSLPEYLAYMQNTEGQDMYEASERLLNKLNNDMRTFGEMAGLELYLRDRTGKVIAKERAKFAETLQKMRERQQRAELTKKIQDSLKWAKKNEFRIGADLGVELEDLASDLDLMATEAARDVGFEGDVTHNSALEIYNAATEDENNNFAASDALKKLFEYVDKNRLKDMSVEKAQGLYRALSALRTEFYNKERILRAERNEQFRIVSRGIYADMKSQGKYSGRKAFGKLFNDEMLTPINRLRRMVGWNADSTFVEMSRQLENAERDYRAYREHAMQLIDGFQKENAKWLRQADGTGKDGIWYEYKIGGKTIEMTPLQRVQLYLESRGTDNMRHMLRGGRTFANRELWQKGDRRNGKNGITVKLTEEDVANITKDMTPREKELARILQNYYNSWSPPQLNAVSNELDGFDRAIASAYTPMHVNEDETETIITGNETPASVALKSRNREAIAATYNADAIQAFLSSVEDSARYIAYAIPQRNWNSLLNYKLTDQSGKGHSTESFIRQAWGDEGVDFVRENIERLLSPGDRENETWFGKKSAEMLSNYVRAVFGANPGIVFKQYGSYPAFAAVLGWSSMPSPNQIRGINEKLISAYTAELDYRKRGFATPETAQMRNTTGPLQTNKTLNFLFNGGAIISMDAATVKQGWAWAENYVTKNFPNLEVGSDVMSGNSPFYKKVAEVFADAVNTTQPMYDYMHRAGIMRAEGRGRDLVRAFTMFKTVPLQQYNTLRRMMGELSYAQQAYKANQNAETASALKTARWRAANSITSTLAGVTYVNVITALAALLKNKGKKYRDDDGNWNWPTFWKVFGIDAAQDLAGMVIFAEEATEVIENALTGKKWYGIEVPGIEQIEDLVETIFSSGKELTEFGSGLFDIIENDGDVAQYLKTHAREYAGGVKDLVTKLSMYLGGFPTDNVYKYLHGALQWTAPDLAQAIDDLFEAPSKDLLKGRSGNALQSGVKNIFSARALDVSDEAAQTISNLYGGGFSNAVPTKVPDKISVSGFGDFNLTESDKQKWEAEWNSVGIQVNDLVKGIEFQEADDEHKAEMLSKLYTMATYAANAKVTEDFWSTNDTWPDAVNDLVSNGATLSQALYWHCYTNDKVLKDNGKMGNMTDTEKAQVLANMDVSDDVKATIFESWKAKSGKVLEEFYEAMEAGKTVDQFLAEKYGDAPESSQAAVSEEKEVDPYQAQAQANTPAWDSLDDKQKKYATWAEAAKSDDTEAIAGSMTEAQARRFKTAQSNGVDDDVYVSAFQAVDDEDKAGDQSGKYSGEEIQAALDKMDLSNEQKAIIWQMISSARSGNPNPYDQSIGQKVYDEMQSSKPTKRNAPVGPMKLRLPRIG